MHHAWLQVSIKAELIFTALDFYPSRRSTNIWILVAMAAALLLLTVCLTLLQLRVPGLVARCRSAARRQADRRRPGNRQTSTAV